MAARPVLRSTWCSTSVLPNAPKPSSVPNWIGPSASWGFGHRIYRVRDPRADVLADAAEQFYTTGGDRGLYDLAGSVELTVLRLLHERKPERRLDTNVEFYTALLLHGLGLPADSFTATFAVARVLGWSAHCLEQLRDGRLIRPQSAYIGPTGLLYDRRPADAASETLIRGAAPGSDRSGWRAGRDQARGRRDERQQSTVETARQGSWPGCRTAARPHSGRGHGRRNANRQADAEQQQHLAHHQPDHEAGCAPSASRSPSSLRRGAPRRKPSRRRADGRQQGGEQTETGGQQRDQPIREQRLVELAFTVFIS